MNDGDDIDLEDYLSNEALESMDLFDAVQLKVVIQVCSTSRSLSDAGRKLFAISRGAKAKANDADRLKKYLARFQLSWEAIQTRK